MLYWPGMPLLRHWDAMCFLQQLCQDSCALIHRSTASCAPSHLCMYALVQCAQGFALEEACQSAAGDVERAQELVFNSRGIQRARDLAAQHAQLAAQAVSGSLILELPSAAVLCCI